jgi:glutaredoxin-related protein
MSEPTQLSADAYHERALASVNAFHQDIVAKAAAAVAKDRIVVIGMSINPHVKRARRALGSREHTYLEFGGYTNMWKQRLALKMWSRWPTFPMVFVAGKLIGGANETEALVASGELDAMLEAARGS